MSVGGFGCMKSNNDISSEDIKMNMLQYAEDKYNEKFDVVDFNLAIRGLDSNYHDVLVLKNNKSIIFNVYSNTDTSECFDDYGISIADKKVSEYFKELSSLEFCVMVDLLADDQILPADINSLSALQLPEKYEIAKIIVVAKVDSINRNIDELYGLYQLAIALNPNLIDFEVVSSNGDDEKLDRVFNNIRLDYENDWTQYPSINESLVATDKNLTKEQFELLIEEV
ncbi:MAG: hypothetical protein ACLUFN_01695 [Eubacterium sp.]